MTEITVSSLQFYFLPAYAGPSVHTGNHALCALRECDHWGNRSENKICLLRFGSKMPPRSLQCPEWGLWKVEWITKVFYWSGIAPLRSSEKLSNSTVVTVFRSRGRAGTQLRPTLTPLLALCHLSIHDVPDRHESVVAKNSASSQTGLGLKPDAGVCYVGQIINCSQL